MLQFYLNYPVGKVSVHRLATCGNIRMMNKTNQREIKVTLPTLSVDLQSEPLELAAVEFVQQALARQYRRFADNQVVLHC